MTEQLSPLKRALLEFETLQGRVRELEARQAEPVAVVGIGCRMPGGVDSPAALWQMLRDGADAVCACPPVPRPGWPQDGELPPAGYLSLDPGAFDPELFGVSHREAASIDPQQRIALECAWEALENAGIAPDSLRQTATGVFMGITGSDYAQIQGQAANRRELIHAHYASGVGLSMASGRIAYLLGLQGPALSIDTACSSSLVATHLACQSLRNRECNLALAGGTSLILGGDLTAAFQASRMLAPDGRCKAFDARANGFGRGEGCGVLVLKRLSDARQDNDPIWAVIRGSALNQDGPSSGLTAPNGPSQEAVIRAALAQAGLEPADVGYVEAHGTGTELGDPLEVQALGAAYGRGREDGKSDLLIGTIKASLGHLEGAAGIAGLIKAILVVQAGEVPRQLHFETPNPHIPWESLPVRVAAEHQPFPATADGKRRAGVSSFGFSGTNAHILVEEPPPARPVEITSARPVPVLPLSAQTPAALGALAAAWAGALAETSAPLADVCHTAGAGRAHLPERLALVCKSRDDTLAALRDFATDPDQPRPGRFRGRATGDVARPVFLFTGQGSQRVGMGRELYAQEIVFREVMDRCDAVLRESFDIPLLDIMFGRIENAEPALMRTAVAQPALYALGLALAELWQSWGVRPAAVLGHSVGEYTAAAVAGVLSLEDGLRIVADRGRLMDALPAGGAMLAVAVGEGRVTPLLAPHAHAMGLAAVNGPDAVVVSGEAAAVDLLAAEARAEGIDCSRLKVSHAFHSHLLDPMLDGLRQVVSRACFRQPRVPLISNLTGRPVSAAELADPAYWVRHAREPVRFHAGLEYARERGFRTFLECGPAPVLCGMGARAMPDTELHWIGSLRRDGDQGEHLAAAVAALYAAGGTLDWRARDMGREYRRLRLPTYPFQRDPLWVPLVPQRDGVASPARRRERHPLLGDRLVSPGGGWCWEAAMTGTSPVFLADHAVNGRIIVPAAAYLEMALAAARRGPGWARPELLDFTILAPLVLDDRMRAVQLRIQPVADGPARLTVHSIGEDEQGFTLHVDGRIAPGEPRGRDAVAVASKSACGSQYLDAEAFYARLRTRGLDFGPAFRGVRGVRFGDGEAFGEIACAEAVTDADAGYCIHPTVLDAGLQLMVAALDGRGGDDEALYLPVTAEHIRFGDGGVPVTSHVRLDDQGVGDGATLSATIRMDDADGTPAVSIQRLVVKRAPPGFGAGASSAGSEATYRIRWLQEEAGPKQAVTAGLDSAATARDLTTAMADLLAGDAGRAVDAFYADLRRLTVAYIVEALQMLGWKPAEGDIVQAGDLVAALGILPRHQQLVSRYLTILAEQGVLQSGTDGYTVRILPEQTVSALAEGIASRDYASSPEFAVVRRCGENLAAMLDGREDPHGILFPGGDARDLAALYRDTPVARGLNGLVRDAVETVLRSAPADRPVRLLEIGGGTGGTTAHVLPALPAGRFSYLFTDIGALFVSRAAEEFGHHQGTDFRVFDLDKDPEVQGIPTGGHDVVLASNVLHATRDIRASLRRVRELLAPGGVLIALEAVEPEPWHDLTVGLLDGWWAFTDTDLRLDYPLLDRARWRQVCGELGFSVTVTAAPGEGDSVISRQALVIARRDDDPGTVVLPESARAWTVLADRGGTAARLADDLRRAGATVELREVPPVAEDCAALIQPPSGTTDVLYCWSLDQPVGEAVSEEGSSLDLWGEGLLRLLQSLAALGDAAPRLHVLTRGAMQASVVDTVANPAQASLWGMLRAIRVERPEISTRIIDLPSIPDKALEASLVTRLAVPVTEPELALRADGFQLPRLETLPLEDIASADAEPSRLTFGRAGVLDELHFEPCPRTPPADDEVEIEIEAAGLNFRDVMHALGVQYVGTRLGGECVGVVRRAGSAVHNVAVGDRVMAAAGAFGDFVNLHADLVARVPERFSIAAAATMPIAFLTADHALRHVGGMQPGETVLIHAGAGGVGMAAVQLALAAGLRVFGTAGTEHKRQLLRDMGVEAVFDSRSLDFAEQVLTVTDGRGVDLLLNSLAGEFIPAGLRTMATNGRFLELGKTGIWDQEAVERTAGLQSGIRYLVVDLSPLIETEPDAIQRGLQALVPRFERGELKPLPHRILPMNRAVEAFRDMAAGRHVGKLVLARTPRGEIPARPDGSYLVTGGLSGLGLLVAERLCQRGAGRLLLVGRNAPDDDAVACVRRLQEQGTAVEVLQGDMGSAADRARVLASARADQARPLRGLVHSAGMLDDALLPEQSWERFRRVFTAKVHASTALAAETASDPLDFLVFFASISGVFGSSGQANHSAANAYLDALATSLTAAGRPALSIAWGAWSGTGAAVRYGTVSRVAQRGVLEIAPERGLALFEQLAGQFRGGSVVASPMDWNAFMASLGRHNPLLDGFLRASVPASGSRRQDQPASRETIAAAVARASPRRRMQVLRKGVEQCVSRVLALPAGRVPDGGQPLGEVGLDSLLAVELRNALASEIGESLPATLLFDFPTVDALVAHLANRMMPEDEAEDGAPSAAAAERQAAESGRREQTARSRGSLSVLDLVEGLSDAEVARRFRGQTGTDHE
ncbi:SDR family NAD(P)-dependent oxidoreductase [Methylonatrum kenyense]|uniref:type I polyketide synthase n=1 Tax=Methylonatrum kenyense TaxID=455253 RepID=UPI0020BE0ACA|nr:type I polyketide synthase [Methylonatrum kenyense]MCK8516800.1 SDR family NAD(P)-dependent oxidoreductase [Methylonatrum kenyense]